MSFALGLLLLAGGSVTLALGLARLTNSALVAAVAGAAAPVLVVSLTSVSARNYTLVPVTLALGSGIAGIGLVLGVAAVVRPLVARTVLFSRGVVVLLAANLLLMFLARDSQLSRADGGVLLAAFAGAVAFLVRSARRDRGATAPTRGAIVLGGAGLVWLVVGGMIVVQVLPETVAALRWRNVPMLLTLLPAALAATSVVAAGWAARRGRGDVLMAGVVGACLCHTLLTVGAAAVVMPLPIRDKIALQVMPAALVFACLLLPIVATESRVPRWEGAILLAAWVGFVVWQITV